VVISDTLDSDQLACFLGYVDGFYTLTATVCHSIVFYIGALTIATFRYDQYGRLRTIYSNHANNLIAVAGKAYSADACCCSSHWPDRGFVKAYSTAGAQCHDDFAGSRSQASLK